MEWVETAAPTIEAAKDSALDRLGVHEEDAEFEVISEGRVGLFGRVKEQARVRARVRPSTPRAKDDRRKRNRKGARRSGGRDDSRNRGDSRNRDESRNRGSKSRGRGQSQDDARSGGNGRPRAKKTASGGNREKRQPAKTGDARGKDKPMQEHQDPGLSLADQADLAESFVRGLGETMDIDFAFVRHDMEDDILRIEATGEDLGVLIGRRGSTAHAVDELVRTVLQRAGGTTREGKIRVDIGGVRARRAKALAGFTRELVADVVSSGEPLALEPMNSADRKLVHDAVGDLDGVTSRSEGEDPHRHVVVLPVPDDD